MTDEGVEDPSIRSTDIPKSSNLKPSAAPVDRATATARFRRLVGTKAGGLEPRQSSVIVPGGGSGKVSASGGVAEDSQALLGPSEDLRKPRFRASRGGYRVRRVRRLVRHIEPWSILKVGLIFYFCVWGLFVIAVRLLWKTAEDGGTIDKVEAFVEDLFALESFEFDSSQILRIFTLGGLVLVVGGTAVTVVLVVLFNLISDLTGGVRFTMVEEETAVRQRRPRVGDEVISTPPSSQPR